MNLPFAILLISLFLQCTAFVVALNMIRITGKKLAWLLLASAILLMVVRRAISLVRVLSDPNYKADLSAELVALTISILLLLGLDRIRPVFKSIKKSTDELLKSREVIVANEEKYRTLVDMMTSIVWTTDPEGRFVALQQSWQNYTGQPPEQYKNFGWLDAIHTDDRDRIQKIWTTAVRERKIYGVQGRIWHHQSGKYRHFVSRAAPLLNPDGTVREWIGKITDVHDRREAEDALRVNEERLKFAVQATTDGVWDWNIETGNVYFSPRWLESLGYEDGDLKPAI
jgi:PAS domain S-box-containing protein